MLLTRPFKLLSHLCLAFALFAITLAPVDAKASDGQGTAVVRKANDTLRALLAEKAVEGSDREKALTAEVTRRLRDFLDIDKLGRLSLQDQLDGLSEEQIQTFTTLLRQLIEQNYLKGLRANLSYEVRYLGEKGSNTIEVNTEIETLRKGRPYVIRIDYIIRRDGKSLRAYDIITDGVGLVKNYRSQFNRIIAKEGFEGLLSRMRRRYQQNR